MKYRVQSNRAALVSSAWRILVVGGSLVVSLTVASMGHFLSSRAALDFRNSSRVDVWQNHTENAGGLDPSFNLIGEKEIPISPNNGSTRSQDQANAIAIQTDGKSILAGYARANIDDTSSPEQFAIVRLNTDGSNDTGFGTGGIVTTQPSTSASAPNSRVQAVAVQTDGKIVTAGFAAVDRIGIVPDFALVRYNANGSVDYEFWEWRESYRHFHRRACGIGDGLCTIDSAGRKNCGCRCRTKLRQRH